MPNDAKLTLILGIGLVVLIGIVFFRVEPGDNGSQPPPTTSVNAVPSQSDPLIN